MVSSSSLRVEAVKILASGVQAVLLNREKCRAWTMAKRCGCPVVQLASLFRTWWYHMIPSIAFSDTVDREHLS